MRTTHALGATAALLVLIGCGGGGKTDLGRGEVTGLVTDLDGNPVRDALVYAGDRKTTTNEAGSYVLTGVSAQDFNVRAQVRAGGVVLRGTTLGRVYRNESTPSVNIAVYPEGNLTTLFGQVRDGRGRVLSGVRVVARPTQDGILSSAVALTDSQGNYELQDLSTDVEYQIAASARTYGDDSLLKTIPRDPTNGDRTQNLVLGGVTTSAPATPTGLRAVAFTTLAIESSARGASRRAAAIEGLKRLRHPALAKRSNARDTAQGNPISIDLTWDEYPLNPVVRPTGFIVYRNVVATQDNGYLLSDPLASLFSDADVNLQVGVDYTYTLKSVSTGYGLNSNVGRSPLSDPRHRAPHRRPPREPHAEREPELERRPRRDRVHGVHLPGLPDLELQRESREHADDERHEPERGQRGFLLPRGRSERRRHRRNLLGDPYHPAVDDASGVAAGLALPLHRSHLILRAMGES